MPTKYHHFACFRLSTYLFACSCDCMCERTTHVRIREFLPGGGGGVQAWLFWRVFLVLNLFYSFDRGCPMVISKKTIIFHGFRGGGATFARGVQLFPGGGGPNANFYRNPYNLWFYRGSGPPIPPLDPHMQLEIHSPENTNKITDVRALTCTPFHFIFNLYCLFIWWKNIPVVRSLARPIHGIARQMGDSN